jgi:SsrA-binding protein
VDKPIAENRKARFNYEVLETFEAGLALNGPEIKAIRAGQLDLSGSYAKPVGGELFWIGGRIAVKDGDPTRSRKLLLHKEQIEEIIRSHTEKRLTTIPLKLYLKKGRAKLLIGLARGRKKSDKREVLKARDLDRELRRK